MMGELIAVDTGLLLVRDLLWQSSLCLLAGLVIVQVLSRRPARAHRILVLAIAGALITPFCGQVVRRAGWGLWTANPADASAASPSPGSGAPTIAGTAAASPPARDSAVIQRAMSSVEPISAPGPTAAATVPGSPSVVHGNAARSRLVDGASAQGISLNPLTGVFVGLWCTLSGVLVVRLGLSLVRGHFLARRARPIERETFGRAAGAACERLGLGARARAAHILARRFSGNLVLGPPAGDRAAGNRPYGGPGRLDRHLLPRAGALAAPRSLVGAAR